MEKKIMIQPEARNKILVLKKEHTETGKLKKNRSSNFVYTGYIL